MFSLALLQHAPRLLLSKADSNTLNKDDSVEGMVDLRRIRKYFGKLVANFKYPGSVEGRASCMELAETILSKGLFIELVDWAEWTEALVERVAHEPHKPHVRKEGQEWDYLIPHLDALIRTFALRLSASNQSAKAYSVIKKAIINDDLGQQENHPASAIRLLQVFGESILSSSSSSAHCFDSAESTELLEEHIGGHPKVEMASLICAWLPLTTSQSAPRLHSILVQGALGSLTNTNIPCDMRLTLLTRLIKLGVHLTHPLKPAALLGLADGLPVATQVLHLAESLHAIEQSMLARREDQGMNSKDKKPSKPSLLEEAMTRCTVLRGGKLLAASSEPLAMESDNSIIALEFVLKRRVQLALILGMAYAHETHLTDAILAFADRIHYTHILHQSNAPHEEHDNTAAGEENSTLSIKVLHGRLMERMREVVPVLFLTDRMQAVRQASVNKRLERKRLAAELAVRDPNRAALVKKQKINNKKNKSRTDTKPKKKRNAVDPVLADLL